MNIYLYLVCLYAIFHLASSSCPTSEPPTEESTEEPPTDEPTTVQEGCFLDDFGTCSGNCGKPNSKCGTAYSYDMVFPCACSYCYYDTDSKRCIGECDQRELSLCLSQVDEPSSINDCQCVSCLSNKHDENGNPICSGKCSQSDNGYVCKPKKFNTMFGHEYKCVCQDQSVPEPPMNECYYRYSIDTCDGYCGCRGECSNGQQCVSNGFMSCMCAATSTPEESTPEPSTDESTHEPTTVQEGCFLDDFGTCSGNCGKPNSKCGTAYSYDMVFPCACSYCYYDTDSKRCIGECDQRELSLCLSQVDEPSSINDCQCVSCLSNKHDENGNPICSGKCSQSDNGYVCKPKKFNTMFGHEYKCVCQDQSVPEPLMNECYYRHSIDTCDGYCGCRGECSNGQQCVSNGFMSCMCAATSTPEESTPEPSTDESTHEPTTVQEGCFLDDFGTCSGNCGKPNSKCGTAYSYDMVFPCACSYCYYDTDSKRCIGECDQRELSLCLSQVDEPSSINDCQCVSCLSNKHDENGNPICSGKCSQSDNGYVCKPKKFNTMFGHEYKCVCQDQSVPEPPMNECYYRYSIDTCDGYCGCRGECSNGQQCVSNGFMSCMCAATSTPEESTPEPSTDESTHEPTTVQEGCFLDDFGTCSGNCGKPNSKCGTAYSYDMVFPCACSYCYYDTDSKRCIGECDQRELSLCLSQVDEPSSINDCQCVSCLSNKHDENGNPICSGKCSQSDNGYVCKPKKFNTMFGHEYKCVCQDQSVPEPPMNECYYRHSIDTCDGYCGCRGECSNGQQCVSNGFMSCMCAAIPTPTPEEPTPEEPTPLTSFPFVSCGSANSDKCFMGTCNERNSRCEEVTDYDYIHCGCVYCNYDEAQDKCVGLCQTREMSKCVPRVGKPQNDADCGCASCSTSYDDFGNAICGGDCLGGSYACKPKLMHIHPLNIQNYQCICQEPSTPDPPPNNCVSVSFFYIYEYIIVIKCFALYFKGLCIWSSKMRRILWTWCGVRVN